MDVDASCALNYIVTAHKPTAVIKAVVGAFTGPDDLNLLVAKSTRIECHVSTAQGLEVVLDVPIFGRVSDITLFRPKKATCDLLFVLVEKYDYFVLQYNPTTKEVDTVSCGKCQDAVGRPSDSGQIALIDPLCRCIGLQLYDGILKVVPMDVDTGKLDQAFNARLDELEVIDMVMLAGSSHRPTVAVLYQDSKFHRHLKAYEISLKDKDLLEVTGCYAHHNLDPGTGMLAPVPAPLGGVLLFGEDQVVYVPPKAGVPPVAVAMRSCIMKAWGAMDSDGSRVLLSDHEGFLYVLVLQHQNHTQVTGLKLERIGRTSCASSLCYLDDGVVYVGSRQGDSLLIRLHTQAPDPAEPQSFISVLQTWQNLGPIVDFAVMDVDKQGQGQLVCCSGTLTDGSLRVVRNGVGINEQASVDLEGIRGLWSLRPSWESVHHTLLVLSFSTQTRILAMNQEEELDEAELSGFTSGAASLWCGNSACNHILQVTQADVRAVHAQSGELAFAWRAPNEQLVVAAGNGTQVVVASREGQLRLLRVSADGITQQACVAVDGGEAGCVDITGSDPMHCDFIAVGVWNRTIQLFHITGGRDTPGACELQLVVTQPLGVDVIPRSVLLWTFEEVPYLLVGLGDGQLHYWKTHPDTGALSDKKKLVLGTKPVILRPFKGLQGPQSAGLALARDCAAGGAGSATTHSGSSAGGGAGVFAASDRPAVLYSSHRKILFANLNENQVTYMAPFNSPSFPDSLAIAKESSLTIGTVDKIQKLHVHTLHLHRQARRIVYQENTHTLGVLVIDNLGMEDEANRFLVLDAGGNMDLKAQYDLEPGELGAAVTSCNLSDMDNIPCFVVGTSIAKPDDVEPSDGRLLVLQYLHGKLSLICEEKVKGGVYDVQPFQGGRLLNSCNNQVQVHKLVAADDGRFTLQLECRAPGHVTSLFLAARGDHVIVGDLMRSISLYLFKAPTGSQPAQLELRAQDYATSWCTALAMLDDDNYLCAENSHNLFVVRKSDATTDEERGRLELVGEFHVGEFINRIRPGSLVLRLPDSELAQVPTWLFGTIDGTIGVIASLPPPLFNFLNQLQAAMRKVVVGVGRLFHADWRAFDSERKRSEAKGFVDGDLLELFLDFKPEDQNKVVSYMGGDVTVEEVTHKLEELIRLH